MAISETKLVNQGSFCSFIRRLAKQTKCVTLDFFAAVRASQSNWAKNPPLSSAFQRTWTSTVGSDMAVHIICDGKQTFNLYVICLLLFYYVCCRRIL